MLLADQFQILKSLEVALRVILLPQESTPVTIVHFGHTWSVVLQPPDKFPGAAMDFIHCTGKIRWSNVNQHSGRKHHVEHSISMRNRQCGSLYQRNVPCARSRDLQGVGLKLKP